MQWYKNFAPQVVVERQESMSEGRPIGIKVELTIWAICPICNSQWQVSCEDRPDTSVDWNIGKGYFPWRLPHIRELLPELSSRIVSPEMRCQGCGTGGGLRKEDERLLNEHWFGSVPLLPQEKFDKMLGDLGFEVNHHPDHSNRCSFRFVDETVSIRMVGAF